jgi:hypothetical protein
MKQNPFLEDGAVRPFVVGNTADSAVRHILRMCEFGIHVRISIFAGDIYGIFGIIQRTNE